MPARFVLLLVIFPLLAFCQKPQEFFDASRLSAGYVSSLKKEYGHRKKYPVNLEKQILMALSYYPELRNTPILFRLRKRHTPLATRCTWTGLLEDRSERHFVITISYQTEPVLDPIIFRNLPFNAQVGVIGHELGHVTDFLLMSSLQNIIHGLRSVSAQYVDRFEFRTDSICIAHGLGYQLLDWSKFVRAAMRYGNWDGPDHVREPMKRERYMNPATISRRIANDPLYH